MKSDHRQEWADLLVVFFGSTNRLDWPDGPDQLGELIARNEALLDREPPGPFVLPWATHEGDTTYVAFATDDSSGQELRRLLDGVVGPTYTTFDGRNPVGPMDEPSAAAAHFAGDDGRVFLFSVPLRANRRPAREQVDLLLHLLSQRPERHVAAEVPIGRLIRDFERALRSGDEPTAKALLWKHLIPPGELSGLNRWFLEVRYLATFEHWRELELHSAIDDLLRINRPALVSDALAQLAIYLLEQAVTDRGFDSAQERIDAFTEHIAGRFGALVPTVDVIRSETGAEYYVLWQLAHGDQSETIQERLSGLAWAEVERLEPYWTQAPSPTRVPIDPSQVFEAEAAGQYERALELVAELDPDPGLLPVVIRATQHLLTRAAFDQADRYRQALGDAVMDEALQKAPLLATPTAPDERFARRSWPERVQQVLAGDTTAEAFETDVDEGTLVDLLRNTDELEELVAALQQAAGKDRAGLLIDGSVRLLRRLDSASGPTTAAAVQRLRRVVLDLWALGDDSGDLSRAEELLDEVEVIIDDGLSISEFGDLVDLLRARWTTFLTDRAFGLSVRMIEILASSRPPDDEHLVNLAALAFQRVTPINASRLSQADLYVAESLSSELGLGLDLGSLSQTATATVTATTAAALDEIGLYSLDEGALARARDVLTMRIPGLEVSTDHSKVATGPLQSLVQRVDLMVVADRAAKHAATDAIRSARGSRPLIYAAGKGSSSLVRAALDYIAEGIKASAA